MRRTNRNAAAGLDLKSINRNNIYSMLWREGRASKQDIVQALQLSLPTVANNLADLCEENLVVENGSFGNTGGRSAKGFSINPTARLAMGIDVNMTHLSLVVMDLLGNIVYSVHEHRPYENTPAYYHDMGEMTTRAVQKVGLTSQQLLGVGISVQGLISTNRREVIYGPILGNTGEVVEAVSKYIAYPCELFHDAESAAFAEHWVSSDVTNAVYLSLSTNLGGAIIINRNIFAGSEGVAGKMEHMTLHPGGLPCYCGNLGCADAYCNVSHLTQGVSDGNLESFFKLLEQGNSKAATRWQAYLEDLSILVNSLYMLLDCDVILGGYMAPFMDKYIDELKALAYARNKVLPGGDYIKVGRFQIEAPAAGAALRYVDDFLKTV